MGRTTKEIIEICRAKHLAGEILLDQELLVLRRVATVDGPLEWGSVFYSRSREAYKAQVLENHAAAGNQFNQKMMEGLVVDNCGGLVLAANPHSLMLGHLVIYPRERRAALKYADILDLCKLARDHPEWTFIHNMPKAAASVLDWAHYQSYPLELPIVKVPGRLLVDTDTIRARCLCDDYAAYSIALASRRVELLARCVHKIVRGMNRCVKVDGPLPFNLIANRNEIWIAPRSPAQSEHAARYIGGFEIGGLFCLPNADAFPAYLPESLRIEVARCTLRNEPDAQRAIEHLVSDVLSAQ